jgi:branched-chain amino acid transport system substrate-binding protein
MAKYMPQSDIRDAFHNYAFAVTSTLVEVLKHCGDDLPRENVMKQAASLKDFEAPMLLPGIKINTSATNYYPIRAVRLARVKGESFELFGDVLSDESQ